MGASPRWPILAIVVVSTAVGCVLRLYQLTRPGFLSGVTEYDDGVYFGSAIRLVNGTLPYRDYVLVQPPGITLLMAPLALLAKATGTATAFAVARVLTACAGAVSVPLAAVLVARRGVLAVALTCGILAVYPAGINAAHTVLLEPWLVLFCLLGAITVFDGERLSEVTRRLAWGGAAFGFAAAIKLWAVVPILVVLVLCLRTLPRRATLFYLAGVVAGFGAPVLPFFLGAPGSFLRDVVRAQLSRADVTRASGWARLESLTGLSVVSPASHLAIVLVALGLGALVLVGAVVGSLRTRRLPPPLEWFALATAGLVLAMFLWPPDYYLHYGWFLAPFLALAAGLSVGRLAGAHQATHEPRGLRVLPAALAGVCVILFLSMAVVQLRQETRLQASSPATLAHRQIPDGACVLTDLPTLTIVSDRYLSTIPGCSPPVDPIGTDYALSLGHNALNGAGLNPAVQSVWITAFARADYVWISCSPSSGPACKTNRRIPWTRKILTYFSTHFRRVAGRKALPNLYVRSRPRSAGLARGSRRGA